MRRRASLKYIYALDTWTFQPRVAGPIIDPIPDDPSLRDLVPQTLSRRHIVINGENSRGSPSVNYFSLGKLTSLAGTVAVDTPFADNIDQSIDRSIHRSID